MRWKGADVAAASLHLICNDGAPATPPSWERGSRPLSSAEAGIPHAQNQRSGTARPRCRSRSLPSAPQCGPRVGAVPIAIVGTAAARRRPHRLRPTRGSRRPRAPPAGCGPCAPRPPAASLAVAGVSQRDPRQSRGAGTARPGRRSQSAAAECPERAKAEGLARAQGPPGTADPGAGRTAPAGTGVLRCAPREDPTAAGPSPARGSAAALLVLITSSKRALNRSLFNSRPGRGPTTGPPEGWGGGSAGDSPGAAPRRAGSRSAAAASCCPARWKAGRAPANPDSHSRPAPRSPSTRQGARAAGAGPGDSGHAGSCSPYVQCDAFRVTEWVTLVGTTAGPLVQPPCSSKVIRTHGTGLCPDSICEVRLHSLSGLPTFKCTFHLCKTVHALCHIDWDCADYNPPLGTERPQ
ncbi:uncharacterized protein ACIQIH_001478 [Cyanocitta cristata]